MDWPIDVIIGRLPQKPVQLSRGKESRRVAPSRRVILGFWLSSPNIWFVVIVEETKSSSTSIRLWVTDADVSTGHWLTIPICDLRLLARFLYNCQSVVPSPPPHCVYICVMEPHEYLYTSPAWEQRLTLCGIKYKYKYKYRKKQKHIYISENHLIWL